MGVSVRSVLSGLNRLNVNIEKVADALGRIETNEVAVIKEIYELREGLIKESSDTSNTLEDIDKMTTRINEKVSSEISSCKLLLSETKSELTTKIDKAITILADKIKSKSSNGVVVPKCDECKALSVQKETTSRLWKIVLILGLIVIALLGLNLFGIIKLPGVM